MRSAIFAAPIFLSAFLLFSVEPMVAKRILPWFGGSAAVWSTCLVFYQTALLLGYAYASLLTRLGRAAPILHIGVVACSLAFLPIGPHEGWANPDINHPVVLIVAMLSATVGLPFVVLSSTSPLLQYWAARAGTTVPYRLFALSNLASLCALLAYPAVVEPLFSIRIQASVWSWLYGVYAVFVAFAAYRSRILTDSMENHEHETDPQYILPTRWIAWFALSACGSVLLLAVTNHVTENVAAVPLLWVLPLAIYLLTFIVAFGSRAIIRRPLWLRILAFALGVLAYAIYDLNAVEVVQFSLPVFLLGLFATCYFCHGELNRLRPDHHHLTMFYLAVAAGGAAGAIFVGILAPMLFRGVYELPLALTFTALLTTLLVWRESRWPARALWLGVTGCMVATVVSDVHAYRANTLALRRSFYGSLRVVQGRSGPQPLRTLFHGTIEHGAQFLLLPRRKEPVTYYGPQSGIGIVLRDYPKQPKRVGVVGLGAGTVAAFGKPGDTFQFFEINSQVIELAQTLFWYTRESGAHVDIKEGDGRLTLAREPGPPFDVLVLDAFSGDAIPVHLLTLEAMNIYQRHLTADGVLAVHVSNNFLDLAPVVGRLARACGLQAVLVQSHADDSAQLLASDWVVITNNQAFLQNPEFKRRAERIILKPDLRPWTDAYNNLLQILKAPELH